MGTRGIFWTFYTVVIVLLVCLLLSWAWAYNQAEVYEPVTIDAEWHAPDYTLWTDGIQLGCEE